MAEFANAEQALLTAKAEKLAEVIAMRDLSEHVEYRRLIRRIEALRDGALASLIATTDDLSAIGEHRGKYLQANWLLSNLDPSNLQAAVDNLEEDMALYETQIARKE